ncbi:MAG: ATP-binding protein [Spirochaetes bacterium]|nr:ATP-binding protein [Spirochaetota bacterium]
MLSVIVLIAIIIIFVLGSIIYQYKNQVDTLKVLINNSEDLIYLYRLKPQEKFEFISQSAQNISGYSPEEFYQNTDMFSKLVHPDDYPLLEFMKEYPMMNNKPIIMRWVKKDGDIIWTEQRHVNIFDKKNNLIAIEGFIRNITHQKSTEFALRESKKIFREAINNANDAIFIYQYTDDGISGQIIEINESGTNWMKLDKEELVKMTFKKLLKDQDKLLSSLEGFKTKKKVSYEAEMMTNDNKIIPVEINSNCIKYEGANAIFSIARDISMRKKMEGELLKTQKLESISILSGGIAHDFNNSLAAILGNLSLAKFYVNEPEKLKNLFAESEKAIHRAKDLTNQLLTFSKGGSPIKKTASIGEMLKDIATFALRGTNVSVDLNIDERLALVDIDRSQMSQVINNLVINARQSMPDGGVVKIIGINTTLKQGEVPLVHPGKYVKICIEDNGCGISKENLARIFDPFFTTKEKGNGLGLAITYSVIKKHGGHIIVNSEEKMGTTFSIFLPASDKLKKEVQSESKKTKQVVKGSGRILIMDDEEVIRLTLSEMLKTLGYEVVTTKDGEETVRKYKEAMNGPEKYDAVIMDLTIPGGMGGKDAIQKLKEIDPAIRAIVSSGYSKDPIMANFTEYGFSDVVTKPYSIEELSQAVFHTINL